MGGMQEKYLAEFEKYKHIVIVPGEYRVKDGIHRYVVVSVDGGGLINDVATSTISENYGSQGYYFASDLGQWFTI